jgi:hypothetical protein
MSDQASSVTVGHPWGEGTAPPHVRRVAARGQWLVDTPRPVDGQLLRWHVEALYVGDLTAIAAAALRERRLV